MSTTDTRAAFEIQAAKDGYRIEVGPNGKDYLSGHTQVAWEWWQAATEAAKATADAEKDIRTRYADYFATIERAQELLRKIAELKFSEPAAKATGTAGELPLLPEGKAWASPLRYGSKIGFPKPVKPANWDDDDGVDWFCHPYFTADQMREYGQQCAEAARSLAISQADYNRDMDELAQDFEPVANMDLLKAKLHIVGLRKRLKNAKAKAEAARQPAPVVAEPLTTDNIACMGFDTFRILQGMEPHTYTAQQIAETILARRK